MNIVNLSFLKGGDSDGTSLQIREEETNSRLSNHIIDIYSGFYRDSSGDLNCNLILSTSTPIDKRQIIEVECKGLFGIHFCEIKDGASNDIHIGDSVIVRCDDTVEIARVREKGEIVRLKRQKLGFYGEEIPYLLRKLNESDYEQLNRNSNDELRARPFFKDKVEKAGLNMKLVDVHFQFDRKRLFFFYTSDGRVDFRELAKELAAEFKTRIELRQIGVRDEAKRMGGLGTCGREYCCASFLNNFKRISTQLATDQNLSTNMTKLSGPCGKLKCCLSFEIDTD